MNFHNKILKASAIVGTGSAAAIIAGIVKSKVMAVLLGPAGVGLYGLLYSVQNTATTLAGMGFSSSGVRQTAEAHAGGDDVNLAITRKLLWWSSAGTGLLGLLVLVLLREPIAKITTGSGTHAAAIAMLGVAVFASAVSGYQTAFLNGLHRLGDLARINGIGALVGMGATVLSVWSLGERGLVVAVISLPLATLPASGWYSSRIKTVEIKLTRDNISEPIRKIFGFGFVFMATSLMTAGTQYATRVIITKSLGISAAGHFQAAWSISMLYLGFILTTMGADYFPRLTRVSKDRNATNRMVNEQTETALLLAGPVIIGMLTLVPQVVGLLYSHAFGDAVSVLRWQVLGDLFKVASWPMAYILMAQGRGMLYFFVEFSWNFFYLLLIWSGLKYWGLETAGTAFFISYLCYFGLVWAVVYRLNDFAFSKKNILLMMTLSACVIFIFLLGRLSRGVYPIISGLVVAIVAAGYSALHFSDYAKQPNDPV